MIPTPIEIIYFRELLKVKNVTKAALRLGVTQPTLTQALHKLEDKLNVKLFERTKKGVIPTPSALAFENRTQELMECWNSIQSNLASTQESISGTFKVGCHQSVAAFITPPLLLNLEKEAPQISVNFEHDYSRKILEKVVSKEVDIGFVVNPFKHPDLVFKKLGNDKVTFWIKKGLSKTPNYLFADFKRAQVESLLGKTYEKHFHNWHLVETSSLELVRVLTKKGLGVGILPERVAFAEGSELELYNKALPSRPDEIYLAYRREVLSSKAGKEFLRLAHIQI